MMSSRVCTIFPLGIRYLPHLQFNQEGTLYILLFKVKQRPDDLGAVCFVTV